MLEALCNIAAIILGLMVGLTVSITLGSQFFMFMEMPFELLLPKFMIMLLIGMSLLILYVGTRFATQAIGEKSIAGILKSGSL